MTYPLPRPQVPNEEPDFSVEAPQSFLRGVPPDDYKRATDAIENLLALVPRTAWELLSVLWAVGAFAGFAVMVAVDGSKSVMQIQPWVHVLAPLLVGGSLSWWAQRRSER